MEIPKVHYSLLIGFLEILDNVGGKSDVSEIASKQGLDLDYLLPILEAGEMLGLVQVKSGDVSITEKGHLFIAASPKVRKKILKDLILNLDIFQKLIDLVKQSEKGTISKEELLEFISSYYEPAPADSEDILNIFNWIIEWGRQSLIIHYNANTENIALRQQIV